MKNISTFLLLVSLLASIRGQENGTAQNKIATGLFLGNNLTVAPNIITNITEDEGKDNELKSVSSVENKYVLAEKSGQENGNVSLEMAERKPRDIDHRTEGMECIMCYGRGISTSDENCYRGARVKTQKCADVEQCFTEIHPHYIKRGCMLPSSINRTFVCKCPLCNNKPSEDLTYYEYTTIRDWEYDNKRLEEPVMGLDLLCKVCDTRGINAASDKSCKLGKNADYMQCGHNQLCFTNIDQQIDFVSRGCIDKPAYNALYFFCNKSRCNDEKYSHPRKTRQEFVFRTIPLVKVTSSDRSEKVLNVVFVVAIFIIYLCG